MELRVALLQMSSCGLDQAANREKGARFCREAKEMGADLALFPEMWNIGYVPYMDDDAPEGIFLRAPENWADEPDPETPEVRDARARWQERAVGRQSDFVQSFARLAEELEMAVAITYLEEWTGPPRNTVTIFDGRGEEALTYAKVQTCDFGIENALTAGEEFPVCDLEVEGGTVRVGAMICFDREFPEPARILTLEGAEIILVPNACPLEDNRIGQFRARAFENMTGVATTNYATPDQNGNSCAFSPVAFDEDGDSLDPTIVHAGEDEGIHVATFDLDEMRLYRSREFMGDALRKPHLYGRLVSKEVREPFVRVDASGKPYPRS